jgi:hypothetical protein
MAFKARLPCAYPWRTVEARTSSQNPCGQPPTSPGRLRLNQLNVREE